MAGHPDLTNLRFHAENLIALAHRCHTQKVYDRVFIKHLELYQKDLSDIKELDMVEFITFLSLGQLVPSTISSYVSGVRHHLKLQGLLTFEDSFLLKLVLKGIFNTTCQADVWLPTSLDILQMIGALPIVAGNPYDI